MIVEIIGLPGTGKSTISRRLCRGGEPVTAGVRVRWRHPATWLDLPRQLARIVPLIQRDLARGSRPTGDAVRKMLALGVWDVQLESQRSRHRHVVIDQGPLFNLATLLRRSHGERTGHWEPWWQEMVNRYASLLELVVWLDGDDTALLDRIRTRAKCHEIKHAPEPDAQAYLREYRDAYASVVDDMTARSAIQVVRIDTCRTTIEEVESAILGKLEGCGEGCLAHS